MPEKCTLIGVGRSEKSVEEFRKNMEDAVKAFSEDKEVGLSKVTDFTGCIEYHRMDFHLRRIMGSSDSLLKK